MLFAARASVRRPRALEVLDQSFGLLEEELVNGGEIGSDLASVLRIEIHAHFLKVPPQVDQLPLKSAGEVQRNKAAAQAGRIKVAAGRMRDIRPQIARLARRHCGTELQEVKKGRKICFLSITIGPGDNDRQVESGKLVEHLGPVRNV
jgi:hypothetical protein